MCGTHLPLLYESLGGNQQEHTAECIHFGRILLTK